MMQLMMRMITFGIKGLIIVLKESIEKIRKFPGYQTYDPPVTAGT